LTIKQMILILNRNLRYWPRSRSLSNS